MTHLKKYRDDVPFPLWIRRITINTIFDEYRKTKKYNESHVEGSIDEEYQNSGSMSFNLADQQFDAEGLMLMLDNLPDISHRVFSLFAIDGYTP